MNQCENCHSGYYVNPPDNHPSYVNCNACGAIKLTYDPQPYQEGMHTVSTGGGIDIIACFGGYG